MKGQSRLASFIEAWINILVGFGIAVTTQIIVFPWFGFNAGVDQNLMIAAIFTAVSLARSYTLRRAFNWLHIRPQQDRETRRQIEVIAADIRNLAGFIHGQSTANRLRQHADTITELCADAPRERPELTPVDRNSLSSPGRKPRHNRFAICRFIGNLNHYTSEDTKK